MGLINSTSICISHLLFANNNIIFCDNSREQLLAIH